ncbi:MAG: helix-turn-helix transcriptional regulator [Candidatus Marinimicrobia bacterium]|jgi:putative transcriptional regulator|nr:helix-turn-helix transcriptional regulator [Candidatus Neomarinimicrobiota bacterium]MBT3631261.1 helix-turn-helix transcriptional regulator [Candidatus Neomarinimicrobiota bacterium]MBT3824769.1 helix-turn-helix transcriptional regulator [Candidatus Neomarinimicrobiota bacterium]MBT4132047.1 helix-turn-helix transcriptional regulator [Candidatus Neomarinimicrobiota bacterium]MBT4296162.1 helix-turn-helix transcriptional regulator [Candidatus Neomarinimicrobiota bacterium]
MPHDQVSNSVREKRKNQGLTQDQLATLVGVSRVSIVAIEGGRFLPTIETALRISQALDADLHALFRLRGAKK